MKRGTMSEDLRRIILENPISCDKGLSSELTEFIHYVDWQLDVFQLSHAQISREFINKKIDPSLNSDIAFTFGRKNYNITTMPDGIQLSTTNYNGVPVQIYDIDKFLSLDLDPILTEANKIMSKFFKDVEDVISFINKPNENHLFSNYEYPLVYWEYKTGHR